MKKLLIIFLILLPLLTTAQKLDTLVSLPISVTKQIVEELIEKDGLVYKVNYQDSLITIYRRTINIKDEIITTYKLNEEGYKSLVNNKEAVISLVQLENKDLKKQVLRSKIKELLLGLGIGVELVIIVLLLI